MALLGPQKPLKTVLASVAMLGVVSSAPALAEDNPTPTAAPVVGYDSMETARAEVELTSIDLRGEEYGVGETVAVGASANYAIVNLHTNNDQIIENVDDTLRGLSVIGYQRVGLILSPGENGYDDTADIYLLSTDGKPLETVDLTSGNLYSKIRRPITEHYPNNWLAPTEPRQTAANTPAYD